MAFVAPSFLLIAKSVDFRSVASNSVITALGRPVREMICYRNYTAARRQDLAGDDDDATAAGKGRTPRQAA